MYYPDELIEEVRTRNDIVDVISGYVRLQKKGSSYFGLCPFHNEKSPSFSVSRQKQMADIICFRIRQLMLLYLPGAAADLRSPPR